MHCRDVSKKSVFERETFVALITCIVLLLLVDAQHVLLEVTPPAKSAVQLHLSHLNTDRSSPAFRVLPSLAEAAPALVVASLVCYLK